MYQSILQFLRNHNNSYTTQTLGERSPVSFSISEEPEGITIVNNAGNSFTFSVEQCMTIINRYNELPDEQKHSTGMYNQPAWPDSPNLIFAPYLPALIRDVLA